MNALPTPKQIVGGFALAAATLCVGVYLSTTAGDLGGTALMRLFYAIAVLIVLKLTFAWGRLRGFPAIRDDGRWALGHIVRNLVMAALLWCMLLIVSAPFVMVAFKLAR